MCKRSQYKESERVVFLLYDRTEVFRSITCVKVVVLQVLASKYTQST